MVAGAATHGEATFGVGPHGDTSVNVTVAAAAAKALHSAPHDVAKSSEAEQLRTLAARVDPADAGAFNSLGVLYYNKGMHAEAVDAFLHALTLDARLRSAMRNLEVAGAVPDACTAQLAMLDATLRDMAARDEPSPEVRRARARLLRVAGRTQDSQRALDALIDENPDDAQALFERGQLERHAGDLQRAQRWFERAANADVSLGITHLELAEVLYQRGQNEQALAALDALVQLDPKYADAHLLRSFVLGDMGRHDAAREAADLAHTCNPSLQSLESDLTLALAPAALTSASSDGDALARFALGLAFRQRGYFVQARQEFQRAVAASEDSRMARHALAELDILDGNFDAARATYVELVAAWPDEPRYHNELGVTLHQAGAVDEASDAYREALRIDPRYALAYSNLGVALADRGDMTAAREAFLRSRELDMSQLIAPLNEARWHQQQGDALAALTVVRELVAFHSADDRGWHEMGLVLRQLQRPTDARDAFAAAVERRPQHAEARYELAAVLNALGDADGALRETQRALELAPVRVPTRMMIGIDVQRECPEACGAINLLSLQSDVPLAGVSLAESDFAALLPTTLSASHDGSREARSGLQHDAGAADAIVACNDADAFAMRGVLGEAVDRYANARALLEPAHATPNAAYYRHWRRAAVGEARSQCLMGAATHALPLLKLLGQHDPTDAEVLVLFARATAARAAAELAGAPAANEALDELIRRARVAIVRVLRREPDSAALMHLAGDAALDIDDRGLAMACFRRSLALDPVRPSARVAIARLLRERGDFLSARLELVAALSAAPDWRDAVLELALVHRDAGRPRDAREVLVHYLAQCPTDLEALVQLAEVLTRLDCDDDARVAVARVLRHEPRHPHAGWLDGLLLAKQHRMRDAMDRWQWVAAQTEDLPRAALARQAIHGTADMASVPRLQLVS